MGRRYYCDYCDKTFIDDLEARRKHISSAHHIKLRNFHYEMCRDIKTAWEEESVKSACRRFMQTGNCQFTGNCKYTHYTPEELWHMKQQIELENFTKMKQSENKFEVPTLESWLCEYNSRHNKERAAESKETNIFWKYPEFFENRKDLPPSLRKFEEHDFKDSNFEEWGI